MIEVKAPNPLPHNKPIVFLAGSIEQDTASNWQAEVTKWLEQYDVVVANPRRDVWDASINQSIDDEVFSQQVNWELTALEESSIIVMYLEPGTKSPISLLELGLFKNRKPLVCCPNGFWRKGNVDIVCNRYGIPCVYHLDGLRLLLESQLSQLFIFKE